MNILETHIVDPTLDGFEIKAKNSQNVEYYGQNKNTLAFIQFHSGSTYFYEKPDDLEAFINGGFYKCKTVKTFFQKLIKEKPMS